MHRLSKKIEAWLAQTSVWVVVAQWSSDLEVLGLFPTMLCLSFPTILRNCAECPYPYEVVVKDGSLSMLLGEKAVTSIEGQLQLARGTIWLEIESDLFFKGKTELHAKKITY